MAVRYKAIPHEKRSTGQNRKERTLGECPRLFPSKKKHNKSFHVEQLRGKQNDKRIDYKTSRI